MTWNIYRHTERSEVSFNIDPETSGFCVVRSDSADTKEQKVRRTTTKCSEQRLFVKQNPRQFRVTRSWMSCWTCFSIFQLTNLAYHLFFFFRTHYSFFSSWYFRNKRVFTARLTALTVTHSAQVSLFDETLPQQKHPVNVFARGERITCTPADFRRAKR